MANWQPEKLKQAMSQSVSRPPRLGVLKAELNRFNWKSEAEEQIIKLAPMGWKAQPIASWPVSLVLAEYPHDGFWMNESGKAEFISACLAKADELYS